MWRTKGCPTSPKSIFFEMSSRRDYRPLWPETTVFIGAGATSRLGMPATATLGKFFRKLAKAKDAEERRTALTKLKLGFSREVESALADLLELLSSADPALPRLASMSDEQRRILSRLYPRLRAGDAGDEAQRLETLLSLRRYYSWDSLSRVIRVAPECADHGDFLRDLFNLLDMHLLSGSGLPVGEPGGTSAGDEGGAGCHTEGRFLQREGLQAARDCLVLFTNLLFACAYQSTREDPDKYGAYVKAARAWARMMQKEGRGLAHRFKLNDRRFYLHSTAFVSLNFDPLFLSLLLSANEEANSAKSEWVSTDGVAEPLKVTLDLGHLWGVRPARSASEEGAAGPWYPFNESVAQRLNDPEHRSGRRVRIAKFYFPHGNSNTRICPNCGKASLHVGSSWRFPDPQLFPPSLIPGLDWGYQPRSAQEKRWIEERGHRDALQCFYCGQRTGARDNFMVMQTSFKGAYTPAISETHWEVRALLEGTRHVVLLGYSLPKDDVIWRAFLAARGRGKHHCTVVVGYADGHTEWLVGDALSRYVEAHREDAPKDRAQSGIDTLLSAREVFGEDRVRAFVGGIPKVFSIAGTEEESLRQMLYPGNWGPHFSAQWWEKRCES